MSVALKKSHHWLINCGVDVLKPSKLIESVDQRDHATIVTQLMQHAADNRVHAIINPSKTKRQNTIDNFTNHVAAA